MISVTKGRKRDKATTYPGILIHVSIATADAELSVALSKLQLLFLTSQLIYRSFSFPVHG